MCWPCTPGRDRRIWRIGRGRKEGGRKRRRVGKIVSFGDLDNDVGD